jgi:hypothetical protein
MVAFEVRVGGEAGEAAKTNPASIIGSVAMKSMRRRMLISS